MIPVGLYDLVQSLAVHQVWCGIHEICWRLAKVPVKRDIEICLSGLGETKNWETKKTVVQPFPRLRETCSFRLGKVSGWPDHSRQELARYLEVVTGRISQSKDLSDQGQSQRNDVRILGGTTICISPSECREAFAGDGRIDEDFFFQATSTIQA